MNTVEQLFDKGIEAVNSKNYKEAVRIGDKLIFLYREEPAGDYILGLVFALQQKWKSALYRSLEFYKKNPNILNNINRIGVSYCQLGEYNNGLDFLKKGMEMGNGR